MALEFFLGSNSPGGFHSFYDWLIDLDTARDVLILKGGPGCGKSSFMRRVGQHLEKAGLSAEYILCSSDPESLDGVIFPTLKAAIVDGTSPHVTEAKFPAAIERYVNLGEHYDLMPIKANREEIRSLTLACKKPYTRVNYSLSAAHALENDMFDAVLDDGALNTLTRRVKGIIAREISPGTGKILKKRFLSAITPGGMICRFDTAREMCGRIYELYDNYGLAPFMLAPILRAALSAGQEVYACYCPMNPVHKLEHLLLPGLGLGFVSSSDLHPYDEKPLRRIRLDACLDVNLLRTKRSRLRFLHKTRDSLLNDAVATLGEAKAAHDKLEALYNPHVNFEAVYQAAADTAEQLLQSAYP